MNDLRQSLDAECSAAEEALRVAVARLESFGVLRDLAWQTSGEDEPAPIDLDDLERRLGPVDRARFSNAVEQLAATLPDE